MPIFLVFQPASQMEIYVTFVPVMRKSFICIVLLSWVFNLPAQVYNARPAAFFPFYEKTETLNKSGFDEFVVDLDRENEQLVGSAQYTRAFWPLNDTASGAFAYAVIRPDTFPIFGSNQAYAISYINGVRLDSIDLLAAHKNLSGTENKIILEFAHTDASWHPTSSVFSRDTLTFTGPLFPGNTLDTAYRVRLRPGTWYTGGVPVAIRIRFVGAVNDTLLLGAGYPTQGLCGADDKIVQSPFYPNSYAFYNMYNELLPTSAGGDIFQECDALPGQDSLADGFSPIQNWSASLYVSVGTLDQPIFEDAKSLLFYPNPVREGGFIQAAFPVEKWELYDATGRLQSAGKGLYVDMHQVPVGIYFLKVKNLHTFDLIKISKF